MELILQRTSSNSSTGSVPYGQLSCKELFELVLVKTQFHDIEFVEKIHSQTHFEIFLYKVQKMATGAAGATPVPGWFWKDQLAGHLSRLLRRLPITISKWPPIYIYKLYIK